MKKIILFIFLFFINFTILSQPIDLTTDIMISEDLTGDKLLFIQALDDVIEEYDKLKEEYNELLIEKNKETKRANDYKIQIELLIQRLEETEVVLIKIKDEKKLQLWSDIIKPGFIFEAACKSTENEFRFDTWYAGIQLLIYKRLILQMCVGYTFNFNVKLGIGFYLY